MWNKIIRESWAALYCWNMVYGLCARLDMYCDQRYEMYFTMYAALLMSSLGGPFTCVCEKESSVVLRMRGLCSDSLIDTYWFPQNYKEGQDPLYYIGVKSSKITFSPVKRVWELVVSGQTLPTYGTSKSSHHSVILGRSNWMIESDGKYAQTLR